VGVLAVLAVLAASAALDARPASAAPTPTITAPPAPAVPTPGGDATAADPGAAKGSITIDLGDSGTDAQGKKKPNNTVAIILLLSVLSIAPALLVMLTGFTRIVIVLALTRNALGLQGIPPNQVVVGLSLFLTFFVMFPTFSAINQTALQPLLDGKISQKTAYDRATVPLKDFMLKNTRSSELVMFQKESKEPKPKTPKDVGMATLIPAFVLSELKTAFIIAFVVFIPFLVIDLVVSSSLMSMGMFMLPPVLVSLPFKLLLFVMVDGWGLITHSLITSFH
jgi:flagellar biosynthetic protein FliP